MELLDLGSGTGVVAIGLGVLGFENVIATDYPHLKDVIEKNVALNSLEKKVSFFPLEWGSEGAKCFATKYGKPCLIVASDFIYNEHSCLPFSQTLKCLLERNDMDKKVRFVGCLKQRSTILTNFFEETILNNGMLINDLQKSNDFKVFEIKLR